jgi:hypothetical protein
MNFRIRRTIRLWVRMNVWVLAVVTPAVVTAPMATAAAAPTPAIAVRNLMPDFWNFWRAARGRVPGVQLQLWRQRYQQPNAAVFADLKSTCSADLQSDVLEKQYFPILGSLDPAMRALSASLPNAIISVDARFIKAFPDMRWRGPVYVMASVGCFNGRSQLIQGQQALLLGVDDMAGMHETNVRPLITHEMFHRYHYSHFAFEPELAQPLWVRLWAEGLATYVAHRLNPGASAYDLTSISPEAMSRMDSQLGVMTKRFIGRLNSTSQADATAYFSDDSENKQIPARAGYYMGLEVARYLARRYSMQTMAHWDHAQANPHVVLALRHLAGSGASERVKAKDSLH